MKLKHELWDEGKGQCTFCLAGPMGAEARSLMDSRAILVWTVEASSHFEAMTLYYEHMGWGTYTTNQEWDHQPYPTEWWLEQNPGSERPD